MPKHRSEPTRRAVRRTTECPEQLLPDLAFHDPASYVIVVQGEVGPEWSGRLGGLSISASQGEGRAPRTTLTGILRDQAQLSGVLATLHSLHLPILRLEAAADPPVEDASSLEGQQVSNAT